MKNSLLRINEKHGQITLRKCATTTKIMLYFSQTL